ncbi:MAG: 3-deoxy-manno-octulosonate-8-phosphatase KdsC [Gammaproteobacteria bacterium]|nr:3-deoxy-manno-octulosonate-8-phosphatase KdsC [Gammaproteobacteria bacterium]MDH5628984.1 3-deoxy-manno-octulosonate-8-phosphatase KdsC [Gammaproteobacteria bacterium]
MESDILTTNIDSIQSKAEKIKLLICDVDGVLSDGKVYYGSNGEEFKNFNIKDGLGLKLLQSNGIQVAIITGRKSDIVERRAKELGISHLYQGQSDKQAAYDELLNKVGISKVQVAHVGDDLPDLPLMQQSAIGFCVADAHWYVKQNADYVTHLSGGCGAVREICDILLKANGCLEKVLKAYHYSNE